MARMCFSAVVSVGVIVVAALVGSIAAAQDSSASNVVATGSGAAAGTPPDAGITPVASQSKNSQANAGNFWKRWAEAYVDDWKGSESGGAAPKFRGYPSPVNGPPFPFSDWPYGGSPVIGKAWTQSSPLMEAVWSGPHGEAWKESGVQIYGWLNAGFNVSTSDKGHYANAPAAYALVPNSIQPDQQVLYIERQPDTVQTDHFDWGFRLTNLYGLDYRFTTAKGIFSQQLLGSTHADGTIGKEYGYDPVMAYFDLYFPQVAQGMNLRIGRYISLPDIEAQLAPNNYTYSHSLLYTYDAYTQTGINATIRLSDHWMVQAGLSGGNDVAPWSGDAKPTLNSCISYTWQNGGDNHYLCLNSLNDQKYAYNNVQSGYYTWYHKINSSWHTATEWWYMWEKDVPNIAGNVANPPPTETNSNGAYCNPGQLTCFAPETAVVNYTERQFGPKNYLTIRNEFFDDIKGQRTGFKTKYSEHLLGWGHWIGTTILMRPELRFEHSYDVPAYDYGTKKTQFMLAGDVIYFF
jgi:hypothetical protein